MRSSRVLRYVLLGGLIWTSLIAFNLLFPAILNSKVLFGGLVALLFTGGVVMIAISRREMLRR